MEPTPTGELLFALHVTPRTRDAEARCPTVVWSPAAEAARAVFPGRDAWILPTEPAYGVLTTTATGHRATLRTAAAACRSAARAGTWPSTPSPSTSRRDGSGQVPASPGGTAVPTGAAPRSLALPVAGTLAALARARRVRGVPSPPGHPGGEPPALLTRDRLMAPEQRRRPAGCSTSPVSGAGGTSRVTGASVDSVNFSSWWLRSRSSPAARGCRSSRCPRTRCAPNARRHWTRNQPGERLGQAGREVSRPSWVRIPPRPARARSRRGQGREVHAVADVVARSARSICADSQR